MSNYQDLAVEIEKAELERAEATTRRTSVEEQVNGLAGKLNDARAELRRINIEVNKMDKSILKLKEAKLKQERYGLLDEQEKKLRRERYDFDYKADRESFGILCRNASSDFEANTRMREIFAEQPLPEGVRLVHVGTNYDSAQPVATLAFTKGTHFNAKDAALLRDFAKFSDLGLEESYSYPRILIHEHTLSLFGIYYLLVYKDDQTAKFLAQRHMGAVSITEGLTANVMNHISTDYYADRNEADDDPVDYDYDEESDS